MTIPSSREDELTPAGKVNVPVGEDALTADRGTRRQDAGEALSGNEEGRRTSNGDPKSGGGGEERDPATRRNKSFRKKKELPESLWIKCRTCEKLIYRPRMEEKLFVCPECNFHFEIPSSLRISTMVDPGTFEEKFESLEPLDPLEFVAQKRYKDRLKTAQKLTGLRDACVVGTARMGGVPLGFGVSDSRFLRGSMGAVVGEKICRGIELARERKIPFVFVSGSGGGARMDEGILSLMQMAKTSAALGRFGSEGGLFISILTNPTMGGAMASFAALGDIVIAEPKALIGFAGPNVIRQTIRSEIPKGFQSSEFLLEHGFLDLIVERQQLRETVIQLLRYFAAT